MNNSTLLESSAALWRDSTTSSLLIFTLVSLGSYLIMKTLRGNKQGGARMAPGLPSLPVIGSFPFMGSVHELPEFLRKTSQKLGPVFSVKLGNQYTVVLNTREVIHDALIKNSAVYSGRLLGYTSRTYINPNAYGIIARQYGSEFRKIHQVTLNILKEFGFGMRLMQERILIEVEELMEILRDHGGKEINDAEIMSSCTLNVINSILFGERLSQREKCIGELAQNFGNFVKNQIRKIDTCPSLRFLPKYQALVENCIKEQSIQFEFVRKFIQLSLESDKDSFVKRYDSMMGKEGYNKEDLTFTIRDLLIAGSETTSTTVQFAMIRMANNPEIQKRVQKELDSVVGRREQVTLEDINKIPYVEAMLLEVMRTQPAVPLALPHYTLDDSELNGFFIPKGSTVIPNIHSVHMDEEIWTDPQRFNPERFLDSDGYVTGKEKIMTFSIGKRSCLGELLARQEIYLIISNLLHKFNILPPEGQQSLEVKEFFLVTSFPDEHKIRYVPRFTECI